MSEADWVLNPLTNRYVKRGSKTHKTLIRSGVIKIEPKPKPPPPPPSDDNYSDDNYNYSDDTDDSDDFDDNNLNGDYESDDFDDISDDSDEQYDDNYKTQQQGSGNNQNDLSDISEESDLDDIGSPLPMKKQQAYQSESSDNQNEIEQKYNTPKQEKEDTIGLLSDGDIDAMDEEELDDLYQLLSKKKHGL